MTLGRGLESLIPPKNPFDKTRGELHQPINQPQDDLGDTLVRENQQEQTVDEKKFLSETSGGERAWSPPAGGGVSRGQASFLAGETQRVEGGFFLSPDKDDKDEESIKGIVFQIETDKISPNPHQPRRHFDETSLRELADSIREFGIIQPLVVSKIEKESDRGWEVSYELVAGERRLLAAKILGLRTVPAIVRQVPVEHEKLELAVTENVQRTNLNPIEFARAMAKLQEDFKLTQREIAARLGKSREVVANTLRLLSLPSEMQEAVAKGSLSESQARLLLSVDDIASREKLFREILNDNLTVREINQKVRQLKGKPAFEGEPLTETPAAPSADPEFISLRDQLEELLGTKVELRKEGEGGKLTISFYSKEELEGILAKLKDRQTP